MCFIEQAMGLSKILLHEHYSPVVSLFTNVSNTFSMNTCPVLPTLSLLAVQTSTLLLIQTHTSQI